MLLESQLKEVHTMVGEASSLWNQIEELWYLNFTALVGQAPRAPIDAIYNQFQSFAQQRQLAMAVADAVFVPDIRKLKDRDPVEHLRKRIRRRMGQLNAQTGLLSGKRNDLVHANFEIANYITPPRIFR